jgi:hypothetical protein
VTPLLLAWLVYRTKCGFCHDSGAGQAPRLDRPEVAHRAEEVAHDVAGVETIDNKLVSATIFEWD